MPQKRRSVTALKHQQTWQTPNLKPMTVEYTDNRLPAMQRMAVKALEASHHDIPLAVLFAEADATPLHACLASSDRQRANAPSLISILIDIVSKAIAAHETFNCVYADGLARCYNSINIGLAVAGDDGTLSVPVIRDTGKLGLDEIDQRWRELADRARAKKLKQSDFGGAAITLSNIGRHSSIRYGTPVIPQGQSGLLAVGAIHPGPGTEQWILPMSFGFDHRINNGAPAAAFLQTIADRVSTLQLTRR